MLLSQIKHWLPMQRQTEYVSGYSASETVTEKQARFVEIVLPMHDSDTVCWNLCGYEGDGGVEYTL